MFLYNSNEQSRMKFFFIMASEGIKFLGINLIKEVKDLYSRNYKTLGKLTEEDTIK